MVSLYHQIRKDTKGVVVIMNKETISKLNEIAKEGFEKAKSMLDGINLVLKTKYGWLNKRVVFLTIRIVP